MKKTFLIGLSISAVFSVLLCAFLFLSGSICSKDPVHSASKNIPIVQPRADGGMAVQYIRHGTFIMTADHRKILVDPMLSDAGAMGPIPFAANRIRNPMIPLPSSKEAVIRNIDAVLLTHYHFDHFDSPAENILPKTVLIFCQPGDDQKLREKGFTNVHAIDSSFSWGSISIRRFEAHHAVEPLLRKITGRSSSYMINAGAGSLFITGDAVLDPQLMLSLDELKPDHIIANAGAAQFRWGKPITLDAAPLQRIAMMLPQAEIIAVHMDAINHCNLTKEKLSRFIVQEKLTKQIRIPSEGEIIQIR